MRINMFLIVALSVNLFACNGENKDIDGDGMTAAEGDCVDIDDVEGVSATIYLGAEELCDGIDNDCDDLIDEGVGGGCVDSEVDPTCQVYVYHDADGDGSGNELDAWCSTSDRPVGWAFVPNHRDCDDTDVLIHPDALEVCDDIDNNCSGEIDDIDPEADAEEVDAVEYFPDEDGDGYGDPEGVISACDPPEGYVEDDTDCDDSKASRYPGNSEVCDGLDNDCDGSVDEDAEDAEKWWPDDDDDGYGDEFASGVIDCEAPTGYVDNNDDCDDVKSAFRPGAEELCDGEDNDCDGSIDEDSTASLKTWYRDGDRDGYGSDDPSDVLEACTQPVDYVDNNGDCDDGRSDVYPGAPEYCDAVDHDCDGLTDGNAVDQDSWPVDNDGDGYGHKTDVEWGCTQPAGTVDNTDDCDDMSAAIHPDAVEICDHEDNDCDGLTDDTDEDVENLQTRWKDQDDDGYGAGTALELCFPSESGLTLVANNDDCDDTDEEIFPGADEVCDSQDNDCDGISDEDDAIDAETWYHDSDGDGHGDSSVSKVACDPPPEGYVSVDNDCDDSQDDVYPGATEVCNSIDDDCNGTVDDDASDALSFYQDADQDGYGNQFEVVWECSVPVGYVEDATDCKDTNDNVYPDATEVCDGLDNDCDLAVDEGLKTRWYYDGDNDGYGATAPSKLECSKPTGYVDNNGDCNDNRPLVHPGAYERCNSLDDDCDGLVDENPVCAVDTGVMDTGSVDTGRPIDTGDSAIDTADTADTGVVPSDLTVDCIDNPGGMTVTVSGDVDPEVSWIRFYCWDDSSWELQGTFYAQEGWTDPYDRGIPDGPFSIDLLDVSWFTVERVDPRSVQITGSCASVWDSGVGEFVFALP